MKRTVQMKTAGVPVAGMRAKNFKGWRKSSKKWRETRTQAGFSKDGLPVHKYLPEPLYVVHPVRRAKKLKKLREWLMASGRYRTAGA